MRDRLNKAVHERRHLLAGAIRLALRAPPGIRSLAGIVLIVFGVFGFLPIVGFWMIPVGLMVGALDIPPLRKRIVSWAERRLGSRIAST